MGDLVLMYWLGFFCGFWACVLVHVYYSVGRQWGKAGGRSQEAGGRRGWWGALRARFRSS